MPGDCRRFCVMTTGRSGSSSLMMALQVHDDIAVPSKQIGPGSNELLRPRDLAKHRRAYSDRLGAPIGDAGALIEAFYRHSSAAAFAGFKSMPHRHADYADFVARPDIRFITLVRADLASTVASFMLAMRRGTWIRQGGTPLERWDFRPEDTRQARGILARLRRNLHALEALPSAIRLTYEDLCDPAYSSEELEGFFGRRIRIEKPQPPTSGASHTGNWEDFLAALDLKDDRRA